MRLMFHDNNNQEDNNNFHQKHQHPNQNGKRQPWRC